MTWTSAALNFESSLNLSSLGWMAIGCLWRIAKCSHHMNLQKVSGQ